MGKFSLRRYEDQAKVSVLASAVSVITLLGLMALAVRAMMKATTGFWEFTPTYGTTVRLAIQGAAAATLFLAAVGFGLGISSVGQRRNERQGLSWLGFFVGAAVLVLAIGVSAFVYFRGDFIAR